jgi:multiple antibiotic resistance protein
MEHLLTLFVGTFTTLLAIVNPLEALPIFLKLMEDKDDRDHLQVARRSCLYATLLLFFFLVFGTAMLKIFEVPLSMVRIVGGIVLDSAFFYHPPRMNSFQPQATRLGRIEM